MAGDSGELGQRTTKNLTITTLAIGLYAGAIAGWLAVAIINVGNMGVPKPLLGILALVFLLAYSTALVLLMWKIGQREQPSYRYFKYLGFWLMAAVYIAMVCVLAVIVLFEMILPAPSFLPSSFASDLSWIALGALLLSFIAFAIWLLQIGLRARRNLRRWLNSTES